VNDQDKQHIHARYHEEKERGVKFYPDIIYKDAVIALALFILLVGLAAFVGVPAEPPADPADTSYVPRPEWYFLFLFEMLKFFPGQIEFVGTVIIPGAAVLALFLLPFFDRRLRRHPLGRPLASGAMSAAVAAIVVLTVRAVLTTPPQAETFGASAEERLTAGEELYLTVCAECHQPEGEGGEVKGVKGLEGRVLEPINSRDVLYTRTDETIYNVVDYGQPDRGMPPFGMANGGKMSTQEINAIVTFVRSWDDRIVVEKPKQTIPPLAEGEVPDYETHVQPIFNRFCRSCHRTGNAQQNFVVTDYQSVMTSGDHAPNVIGGDPGCNMVRLLNREEIPDVGAAMPPTRPLDPKNLDVIVRWIEAGALPVRLEQPVSPIATPTQSAAETAPLAPTQEPTAGASPTPAQVPVVSTTHAPTQEPVETATSAPVSTP
jgi:mono/diheme cytochrome c family protein